MEGVTTEQAIETYKKTVRDEFRENWPNWVLAVSNSLAAGEWIGFGGYPDFAEKVFETLKGENKVSMSDSR